MSIGREYKIVIAGSMGAGKTTAITAISDVAPVSTEVANSDQTAFAKASTTVALDYGEIALDGGDRVRLYGAPGQVRFKFMWKIVARGAIGLVLLIDNNAETALQDLEMGLDAFDELVQKSAVVIGITHCDTGKGRPMSAYRDLLIQRSLPLPVFSIDARRRDQVLMLVDALMHSIEAQA